MKITTNTNDKIKLESALVKADRLTKLYKCSLIDLMVLSMNVQRQIKIESIKNLK